MLVSKKMDMNFAPVGTECPFSFKFYPSVSNCCWCCLVDDGSLLHISWQCLILQTYWQRVHQTITEITTYNLDFSPSQYLLHHTFRTSKHYLKALAMHTASASRMCVPTHWSNTSVSSLNEWLTRLDRILGTGEADLYSTG